MGKIDDLNSRYDEVRDPDGWWEDALAEQLEAFAAGDIAMSVFGHQSDSLDHIFVLAEIERTTKLLLDYRIAVREFSWNEIAAALGVSRQAAVKRFGPPTRPDRAT